MHHHGLTTSVKAICKGSPGNLLSSAWGLWIQYISVSIILFLFYFILF